MKKTTQKKPQAKHVWNLALLYSSPTDPQIENDVTRFEDMVDSFAKKYDTAEKEFLIHDTSLLTALKDYEEISANTASKAILYFHYTCDTDASNTQASAKMALLENRFNTITNKVVFFELHIGAITPSRQNEILHNKAFSHFRVFLERVFKNAQYNLSVAEEKIMSLKDLPAHSMWMSANDRILHMKTVSWKGKELPLPMAMQTIANLPKLSDRKQLSIAVNAVLKSAGQFAEAEINAVFTDKKINDQLRGYKTPYEATVIGYRNDAKVVDELRKVVTAHVGISHNFYKLKARLLKQKKLGYFDRATKIGTTRLTYSFADTISKLKETFGALNPKYRDSIDMYIKNGQIDAFPRVGKRGGAYQSGSYGNPVFVLLNHTDDLKSFMTCAHELGHAMHTESSRIQTPLYSDYSISLAETASTLFEGIGLQAVFKEMSDQEKIIVLHDQINDDISTIFRQIACFNFESDLHATIRSKGYISKEEMADIHNKNMSAYLGPVVTLTQEDGYMFVAWDHIRYFFYVYTYAYGQLVSRALLRRYKKDPTFWKKIEQFLSAGGKDSPENILKEIGIDVSSPEFFKEGLMEIADDVKELERLTRVSRK